MPYRAKGEAVAPLRYNEPEARLRHAPIAIAKPRVIIPVFPGTNCEYDTAQAFEKAGAEAQVLVINNLTPAAVAESCEALVKACLVYTSLLRDAGAAEVHYRISAPPFTHPCYFGTDVPDRKYLLAVGRTIEEITRIVGADSVGYLSVEHVQQLRCV